MASIKSIALALIFSAGLACAQIPVSNGGTGSKTASGARSNLGAAAAADVVPSGMIMFTVTSCPSGWTEQNWTADFALMTIAANGDAGTTGSASVSLTAAAQTFTGTTSQSTSAVSAGTPAGTNTLGAYTPGTISWPAGVPTIAAGVFTQPTISWPANVPTYTGSLGTLAAPAHTHTITQSSITTTKFTTSSSGSAAYTGGGVVTTPSGSASSTTITGVPGGTVAWPANPPTNASGAFAEGAISWPLGVPTIGAGSFTQPTFTGTALGTHSHTITPSGTNGTSPVTGTVTPAYIKLIPCKKN